MRKDCLREGRCERTHNALEVALIEAKTYQAMYYTERERMHDLYIRALNTGWRDGNGRDNQANG